MKRFLKSFRYGQKGFTLIELLIVVAILGILAAVIVPNLGGFLTTGKVAAANTEVANVETAALAYYADNDGNWPTDTNTTGSNNSLMDPPGAADAYLDGPAVYNYKFDAFGKVGGTSGAPADGSSTWGGDSTIVWDDTAHKWKKK